MADKQGEFISEDDTTALGAVMRNPEQKLETQLISSSRLARNCLTEQPSSIAIAG
jgi:hypothetical protein